MTFKKSEAVVLKVDDLGESDLIVTFYSKQAGKIAGIARGAKRS
ncbi:MAG: recombination protein O N-terminal domain-containing protein [Deltaproteobacteria bacterium]|jgi:DNA repair protein RecO (recombination protein O)|nr:recombination protein O N-terminal domain-containing protein [Deltaproteobacteria bacterium]